MGLTSLRSHWWRRQTSRSRSSCASRTSSISSAGLRRGRRRPGPCASDGRSGSGFTLAGCTLALRLQERSGMARSWARSPTIWHGASLMCRSPLSPCFTSSRPFSSPSLSWRYLGSGQLCTTSSSSRIGFSVGLLCLLVSANTVLFVASQRGNDSLASAVLTAPGVWLLVAAIACGVWPWMLLRKVPISVDRPSAHTAVVSLSHGVKPGIGTTRPISRSPIVQWHHFAILPAFDGSPSYRMVISRAGDWTAEFINDPPQQVWVRGIPTVGMAIVRRLFTRVIFVATGSGIGPTLPHLLTREAPSRLVWVTKDPRLTYGDALVDEITEAQPDAIIWNTDKRGKPDVLRLAYAAYLESKAEAVVCISNSSVTWQVVHGLERRGIPAFGPIWDS